MQFVSRRARIARLLATTLFVASAAHIVPAHAQTIGPQPGSDMVLLPTGVFISPTAVPGASQQALIPSIPNWPANLAASEAIKSRLSPDGNTLAVITAGYNDTTLTDGSGLIAQFISIFDVSGENRAAPKLKQTLTQKNSFAGLVWSGNTTLYSTGGTDDNVFIYKQLLQGGSRSTGPVQQGPMGRPDGRPAVSGSALGLQDDLGRGG